MVDPYKGIVRPVLFRLNAERAHELGKTMLRHGGLWSWMSGRQTVTDPRLQVSLAGVRLRSPVGLAAGFDKDAEMLGAMDSLGFGYAIAGSIRGTQVGDNPSPRIIRYPDRESMINCQGMPSRGGADVAVRLRRYRERPHGMAVIANIAGFSYEEYEQALTAVQPYADAIEYSLSCPNERYDSLDFLDPDIFQRLFERMNALKSKPFFVKIRNYNNEREKENRFRLVELCLEAGVDGITIPGAHIVDESRLSLGHGNLSGKAVFSRNVENVREIYAATGGRLEIKALGGVFTAQDAFEAISAGASSVELLTGLVYEGWAVAKRINQGLLQLLDTAGIGNVRELRGSGVSPRIPGVPARAPQPA